MKSPRPTSLSASPTSFPVNGSSGPAPLWRKNTASRSVSSAFCREGLVSKQTASVLQNLYDIASSLGAEMTFYFNNEPALTAAVHASQNGAIHIVSGTPGADSNLFIETVKGLLPELPMSLVDADGRLFTFPAIAFASAVSPAARPAAH